MKNLKLFSFALFIFIFSSNAWSQAGDIELKRYAELDTFKLKNYYLPKLKYDKLDFSVFLNSNNGDHSYRVKNDFEFDSGIYLSNHSYRNSSKLQYSGINSIYIAGGYGRKYNENDRKTINNKAIDSELKIDNSFRFYNKSKRFFEFDIKSNLVIKEGEYYPFHIRDYNEGLRFNMNLGFHIGYGRVEDVTDAWRAIRMLKDFKKIGKLSKTPDGNDVIALANAISTSNNIRAFDKRIKRVQQLKIIDNIITSKHLVKGIDFDYFTSLYDLYSLYSFYHPVRNAGSIFSLGLSPLYNIFYNKGKQNYGYTNYGLSLIFKNEYYKPINMFYQFDFGYYLGGSYVINKLHKVIPSDDKNNKTVFINSGIFSSFSYYPSTRTVITSKINISLNKIFWLDTDPDYNDIFLLTSWSNRMTYYLSPRTRLNLNLYLYYLGGPRRINASTDEIIFYRYSQGISFKSPTLKEGITYFLSFKFNYAIF